MSTASQPAATMTPQRAFELLTIAINGTPARPKTAELPARAASPPPPHILAKQPEIQQRVNAHCKAATGFNMVQLLTSSATDEVKCRTFLHCCRAVTAGKDCDFTILQGQENIGKGDKRADPLSMVEPKPVAPVAPAPAPFVPPAPRAATPAAAAAVAAPRDKSSLTGVARIIFDEIEPFLPQAQAAPSAPVDEDAVRSLVTEGLLDLPDRVKNVVDKHLANGGFPSSRVEEIVSKAMEGHARRIEIVQGGEVRPLAGRAHFKFELLLKAAAAGLNVALVGPAGSGKTVSAAKVAKALDLEFAATSFGPMTSKADLFGMINAQGVYRGTDLVRLAVNGGLFLGDEFDAGNAGVGTYLNMLTANEHFGTPDGMKTKHEKFRMIIGMNTFGTGASRVYVGRNQMDGATLDRYAFIEWPYDDGLEASMVGVTKASPKFDVNEGGFMAAAAWLEFVGKVRAACDKTAIRAVVSPRATQMGVALFNAGVGRVHVENMVVWKGMDAATVAKVRGAL